MYRVMLLDDEPWELKGLKNMIPWKEYGFIVTETLSNPFEAVECLKSRSVDVLVSDIRMPGLSGIDLLKQLRPLYPELEILFLSGYAEFEYAQNALRLGAFDYLLKPVDLDTIGELLTRLAGRLAERKTEASRRILEGILNGEVTLAGIFSDSAIASAEENASEYFAVRSAVELGQFLSVLPDLIFQTVWLGSGQFLYFIRCRDFAEAKETLKKHFPTTKMGISLPYGKPDATANVGVPTLLVRQCQEAYFLPFITGKTEPHCYAAMNLPEFKKLMAAINDFSSMPPDRLGVYIRTLPEYFRSHSINLTGVIWFWNQSLIHLPERPELYEEHCILDINQLTERFSDVAQLCLELASLVEKDSGSEADSLLSDSSSELYRAMIEYVDTHYQEPITLQDVADKLHISFAYASRLFKKYTDTNYSKYLTGLRLAKAQRLLTSTSKTVEEICFEIGYNDYFYFNKTFKKYSGMTPLQYRRQVKKS